MITWVGQDKNLEAKVFKSVSKMKDCFIINGDNLIR